MGQDCQSLQIGREVRTQYLMLRDAVRLNKREGTIGRPLVRRVCQRVTESQTSTSVRFISLVRRLL